MLQHDRLAYYFSLAHELPDVEFKGPGMGRTIPLFGRVVRAAIAMANRPGGGTIIIGVSDTSGGLQWQGLTAEELATWKYESIADGFNSYASSPIEFDRLEYMHNGATFLILSIHEFASTPIMCIKEYRGQPDPKNPKDQGQLILQAGALYIRTANKPESKQMLTSEEVRLLSSMIGKKAVVSFVSQARMVGVTIAPQLDDDELFVQQLKSWDGPLLLEIVSRGYWDVRIRPTTFHMDRVSLRQVRQLLPRIPVKYRGWEFPTVSESRLHGGADWLGMELQVQSNLQAWRFFRSGQYAIKVGIIRDWGDRMAPSLRYHEQYMGLLSTVEVVSRLTEVFELAANLAATELYSDERSLTVEVILRNVAGRRLFDVGTTGAVPLGGYITDADSIPYTTMLMREDAIGRPRDLALEAARHFFGAFCGWDPSTELLKTMQTMLTGE